MCKNCSYFSISYFLLIIFLLAGCSPSNNRNADSVEEVINHIESQFAPDSRTVLFDVHAKDGNGGLLLSGETSSVDAKNALIDSLSSRQIDVTDSISVLPAQHLNGKVFGVINNSVANLRSEPSHPSQLATQATLGMPVKVLKRDGDWYYIQTPDDYLSWVDHGGIQVMDKQSFERWSSSPKIIYLQLNGSAYQEPSISSFEISDLVGGSILASRGKVDNFYQVQYPDGRIAYVPEADARPFDEWKTSVEATEDNLVQTAKQMIGRPYLWGGTSSKGMDCSGFTKTIFFMNGWVIPRDASQQVHAGEVIDTSDGFDNLRPGDLLFFGTPATESSSRRVVHVGMWIGSDEFIHSSGRVHISSVNPQSENFDEFNLNRFLEARRYLDNQQGNTRRVADLYSSNQ
ncbi:MAG: C40 family peptidase [Balneolaceae bacterium]|nr:C40 family peptidase [Balneolaceae bacterium]MDR9410692.1 C40 family peptidase [Balneolaceae bacterium]